ncbi:MAG TPA: DUF1990 domain-containing protein [Acidothermaceae bacterium]
MSGPPRANRPLLPGLTIGAAERTLRRTLRRASALDFNYADVGASREQTVPTGCDSIAESAVVGAGLAQFTLLAEGIRNWQIHRHADLQIVADHPAREGVNVAIGQRLGPATVVLSCRVVWTLDEPDRNGFAYGSLVGHPEAGEEAFVAELEPDGAVRFRVYGFTAPGTVATAAARPLTRALARRALLRYLPAARDIASR